MNFLIAWAFLLITIAYLIALTRLASSLKGDFREHWESIGDPSIWDARGQQAILGIIIWPNRFTSELLAHHWRRIKIVRMLGIADLICFSVLLLMIFNGTFDG